MKTPTLPRIPTWHNQGRCAGQLGWLDKPEALQLADCHACPVLRECRAWAIETGSTGVVIGGMALGINKTRRK